MLDYLLTIVEKERPEVLTIASVSGVLPEEEAVLKGKCSHLLILDKAHTNLLLKYDFPEYLSCDRAAGLVAARHLFKGKACSIFDFGTTLTMDFLSSEGALYGRKHIPGMQDQIQGSQPLLQVSPPCGYP